MTDRSDKTSEEPRAPLDCDAAPRAKRAYEPPRCEKKRSIHRVTLISSIAATSVSALSMTN